jgi:hypothetical protein
LTTFPEAALLKNRQLKSRGSTYDVYGVAQRTQLTLMPFTKLVLSFVAEAGALNVLTFPLDTHEQTKRSLWPQETWEHAIGKPSVLDLFVSGSPARYRMRANGNGDQLGLLAVNQDYATKIKKVMR